jgi:hypothetical protein
MRWVFLVMLAACVDEPLPPDSPSARVIASWDPLACGEPHRIAIELDGNDDELADSAPCALGSLVLDVPELGAYRVRIGERELELSVDQPVVELEVAPPL